MHTCNEIKEEWELYKQLLKYAKIFCKKDFLIRALQKLSRGKKIYELKLYAVEYKINEVYNRLEFIDETCDATAWDSSSS